MSLQGSLDTFALTEVLALLAGTKKRGALHISSARLEGSLWLDGGHLIGSDVPRAPGIVDAVFELLRLKEGEFVFNADDAPPDPLEPENVEAVLADAEERLGEWRGIEAVVPSLSVAVALAADAPGPQVVLEAHQWRLLVGLAAGRPLTQVADEQALGEFEACRTVKQLVEAGLASVEALPEPAPAPKKAPAAASTAGRVAQESAPPPAPEPEPKPAKVAARLESDAAPAAPAEPPTAAPRRAQPASAMSVVDRVLQEANEPAKAPAAAAPAAASGTEDAPAEDGAEVPPEQVDRGALLKFLSSVRN
ncbi:MAG TPA: DUF4388 domain-containing protein [Acidimicrobiales bacterium]|nr:DUF4388 domain-containing protein [Acidimicrobiales bacterium]